MLIIIYKLFGLYIKVLGYILVNGGILRFKANIPQFMLYFSIKSIQESITYTQVVS